MQADANSEPTELHAGRISAEQTLIYCIFQAPRDQIDLPPPIVFLLMTTSSTETTTVRGKPLYHELNIVSLRLAWLFPLPIILYTLAYV